jgi:branched-chain amino acid transport system substrate-binding protein
VVKKIGVLVPKSSHYGAIGVNLLAGLRNSLTYYGNNETQIIPKSIAFGAHKNEVYKAAEQLIVEEDVQLLVAYISNKMVQVIRALVMATNKILLVLDAGANLPQESPTSPNIFYISLHNALGAWLAAKYAIKDGYKEAAFTSCFYDGGYLHTYAIAKAFTHNGGNIIANHVVQYNEETFTMLPLHNLYEAGSTACTLAIFSGEYAQWFYKNITPPQKYSNLYVYAAPFTLEEQMLQKTPFPQVNVKGVVSWSATLDTPENNVFKQVVAQETDDTANVFHVLGWEAGQLIINVLSLIATHKKNILAISMELKQQTFNTPRGLLCFNNTHNTTLTPMYEVMLTEAADGNSALKINSILTDVQTDFEVMAQGDLKGATSGWFNSYVCN